MIRPPRRTFAAPARRRPSASSAGTRFRSRPRPESLEPRLAPTADFTAIADGYVQGGNSNSSQGAQLNITDPEVKVSGGGYQRGLVLFGLGSLDPTDRITGATLSVDVNLLQYGSTGGTPTVTFYGFQGDGILGLNDYLAADRTPVGSLNTTSTGVANVPIDASFLQSLVGRSRYAEFSVEMTAGEDLWFDSTEAASYAPPPTLHLVVAHAPVAVADAYATPQDTTLTVADPGVLADDTDADGRALTAALVSGPAHGSLTLNADGSFAYTPTAGFNGPDSFTYKANDGVYDSNPAVVSLAVGTFTPPPQASDDAYTLASGQVLSVAAPGVLANDNAPSGQPMTAALVSGPAHGTLIFGSDGSFTYTPTGGYVGSDSFTYAVSDGTWTSSPAAVALNSLGSIRGRIWDDINANGVEDPSEPGLAGRTVYLDQNQNARVDPGELTAVTAADGTYAFTGLPAGGYLVAMAPYTGWQQTAPTGAPETKVDLSVPSSAAFDFGSVRSANSAPVAANDSYKTPASTTLTVAAPGVMGNDSDPDGDPITARLSIGVSHGTLAFNADGSFTYTPTAGYNGPDSFTYTVSDGRLTSPVATVSLDVGVYNHPPVAADDSYAVAKSTAMTVAAPGVLANDSDPDAGQTITARIVGYPSHGSLSFLADGSFTYTPFTNYLGTDSFTYQAFDGSLASNTATVHLTISGPDDPPTAANDSYIAPRNSVLTVSAAGVLGNDYDPNGQAITAVLGTGPAHGTLTLSANGSFVYHPATDYSGPDSFTYTASDGQLASNVATVSLYVDGAPVAAAESLTTDENQAIIAAAPGVLANDTDPDPGDTLTAVLVYTPSHGSITLHADGSFTYTPTWYYYGTDSFSYRVWDGHLYSSIVTDTITVNHINQPPAAAADSYEIASGGTLTAAVSQTYLDMQSDPGDWVGLGRTYTFGPSSGTFSLSGSPSGVIVSFSNATDWWYLDVSPPTGTKLVPGTYTNAARFPSATQPGLDVFGDGRGSNTVTGQFTVTQALYDAQGHMLAFSASFEQHSEGNTAALYGQVAYKSSFGDAEGLLFNDSDPDYDPLTVSLVAGPSHGSLGLNADGSFTYTPAPGFAGTDRFTYTDSDGQLASNVATASILVYGTPAVANLSGITDIGVPLTAPAPGVLAGAVDPAGLPMTASLVAGPAHGTVAVNADGSFTYTPAAGYFGPDAFTFQASNGRVESAPGTYSIVVNAPPTATDLAYTSNEDQPLNVNAPGLLAGGSDPDGDPLIAALVAAPAHGTITVNADGSFTYVPALYYAGPDSFTYKVNDGRLDSNTATVALTVNFVNQAPTFTKGDDQSVLEDSGSQSLPGWATGISAGPPGEAGQSLSFTVTADNPGLFSAAPSISSDGTLTYTPAPDAYGTTTITVVLHDGGGTANGGVDTSAAQTFSIAVAPVNDPPTLDPIANQSTSENQAPIAVNLTGITVGPANEAGQAIIITATSSNPAVVPDPSVSYASLSSAGTLTIAPLADRYGTAAITVTVEDSGGTANGGIDTIIRTFVVTVARVDQPPTANSDAYHYVKNSTLGVATPGVLANDTDPENDPLTAVLIAGPRHGSLTLNADGSFVYAPKRGYTGTDSFTYQASDGTLRSKTATVTLSVGSSATRHALVVNQTRAAGPTASPPASGLGPSVAPPVVAAAPATVRTRPVSSRASAPGPLARPWLAWAARRSAPRQGNASGPRTGSGPGATGTRAEWGLHRAN